MILKQVEKKLYSGCENKSQRKHRRGLAHGLALERDCMTRGEALAIIQMLDTCKKDISFRSIKRVAKAIGIKAVDGERVALEKMIQARFDIKREDEATC